MTNSHVAGWSADSPTPAQLKELFAQVSSGRITKDLLQGFLNRQRTIKYIQTESQIDAQAIMGNNYLGPEVAIKHFNVFFTCTELQSLTNVPFSGERLEKCKDTHFLIAIPSLTIVDMLNHYPSFFVENYWYKYNPFANVCAISAWYLINKKIVPHSTSKTWNSQLELLKEDQETLTAREITYLLLAHFLVRNIKLLTKFSTATSSVSSSAERIFIGHYAEGVFISRISKAVSLNQIGLMVAEKPDYTRSAD